MPARSASRQVALGWGSPSLPLPDGPMGAISDRTVGLCGELPQVFLGTGSAYKPTRSPCALLPVIIQVNSCAQPNPLNRQDEAVHYPPFACPPRPSHRLPGQSLCRTGVRQTRRHDGKRVQAAARRRPKQHPPLRRPPGRQSQRGTPSRGSTEPR